MMPMLPYITDTGDSLELMFSTFKNAGVNYLFPAGITLFGQDTADSKTLVFRAVEKNYPHLLEKYQRLFANGSQLPAYYRSAFGNKMQELLQKYDLKDRII
jgi:DNA repair photolyase